LFKFDIEVTIVFIKAV